MFFEYEILSFLSYEKPSWKNVVYVHLFIKNFLRINIQAKNKTT